jgi:hypothetical protein
MEGTKSVIIILHWFPEDSVMFDHILYVSTVPKSEKRYIGFSNFFSCLYLCFIIYTWSFFMKIEKIPSLSWIFVSVSFFC